MKIITWNCNMAFRKKADMILTEQPDILIVPECECADKLLFPSNTPQPTDFLWFGNSSHKGLGVFSYGDFRLQALDGHNEALRMIVPIAVKSPYHDFNLFAIWANNPTDPDGPYVEQIWKALDYYDALLHNQKTILAGDFNSNTIWDRKRRISNHSNVVKRLEAKGIYSVYHMYYQQIQGKEQHPTYYLYRHLDKPYHLDYCFVSADLMQQLQSVTIGAHDIWSKYSDHVPIVATFSNA